MNETEFLTECEYLPSIKTNRVGVCDQAQKVVTIRVNIDVLEHTLIDAFDTIGYRIYDKTKKKGKGAPVDDLSITDGPDTLNKW